MEVYQPQMDNLNVYIEKCDDKDSDVGFPLKYLKQELFVENVPLNDLNAMKYEETSDYSDPLIIQQEGLCKNISPNNQNELANCTTSKEIKSEQVGELPTNNETLNQVDESRPLNLKGYGVKFRKIFCNQCDFVCRTKLQIMDHCRTHYELTAIKNEDMDEYDSPDDDIYPPKISKNTAMIYRCRICNLFWKNHHIYVEHKLIHNDKKCMEIIHFKMTTAYSCEICNEEHDSITDLDKHKLQKHSNNTLQCKQCPRTFTNNIALEKHTTQSHTNSINYICELCAYSCKSSSQLYIHKNSIHKDPTITPFKCPKCPKSFKSRRALVNHMHVHKQYNGVCELCQAVFTTRYGLHHHMRRHEMNEKKFVCTICPKAFTNKDSLKRHVNTHTGEKTFKCETCGKCFNRGSNLRTHLSVHTGVKGYVCEVCGSAFRVAVSLRTHMAKYHLKEK